jgi:hypothetical protein
VAGEEEETGGAAAGGGGRDRGTKKAKGGRGDRRRGGRGRAGGSRRNDGRGRSYSNLVAAIGCPPSPPGPPLLLRLMPARTSAPSPAPPSDACPHLRALPCSLFEPPRTVEMHRNREGIHFYLASLLRCKTHAERKSTMHSVMVMEGA